MPIDDEADEQKRQILAIHAEANGPVKSEVVYGKMELEPKTVANRLFQMKQHGLLVATARGLNDITAKGRAYLASKPTSAPPKPVVNRGTDAPKPAHVPPKPVQAAGGTEAAVLALLRRCAQQTQEAMDEYLSAIADPRILEPLRIARDQTRTALQQFEESA